MKKFRLGNIANVEISGIDKKTKEGESAVRLCNFTDVYYNWAITKNMYDGLMQASASDSDIETFSLRKGQVAITKDSETRDDIGVATYIADDFEDVVLGYHCALITPRTDVPEDEKIYGKYLNALLHTKYAQKYFSNNATGSGQRYTLSKEAIEDMPVYLPSYKEQVRIGDYLSDIDKKIEINNLINAELEAMAKQIYDYWFVQFDFPNEEGKPYKSSGGKMVWNETLKREIPDGWRDTPLSKIAKIENGATPSTLEEDNYGGDISWITPKDLSDKMTKFLSRGERSITQKGYDSCSTTKIPAGSILMSSRAPIGLVAIASDEVCTNQGFKNLVPEDMDDRFYLYYYIRMYMPFIEALGSGTTFKEVSKDSMLSFPVLKVNNDKVYRRWITTAEQVFGKQNMLEKEIDELQSLRGYLLPLLMNGQVTIKV